VTGHSLDESATTQVSQQFEFSPFIRNTLPAVTLISMGNISLTNNINIDNKDTENDTVIWTGGTLNKSSSVNVPRSPSQTTSSNKKNRIVTSSRKLSLNTDGTTKNDDAYFETFFSNTKENIKKVSTVINCTTTECTNNNLDGLTGLIWVEGDLAMSHDKETGKYEKNAAGIITEIDPIILIVTGNFKMSHKNSTINGLVYIMGNWRHNNGNAKGKLKAA